jgi:hypothetical protein
MRLSSDYGEMLEYEVASEVFGSFENFYGSDQNIQINGVTSLIICLLWGVFVFGHFTILLSL